MIRQVLEEMIREQILNDYTTKSKTVAQKQLKLNRSQRRARKYKRKQ